MTIASLIPRAVKQKVLLQQGHQMVMLDDAMRVLKANRGRTTGAAEGDDDLQLGDNLTVNYPTSGPPAWLMLLLAALAAAAGTYIALDTLFQPSPPVVESPAPADTDTQYDLGFRR